MTTETPDEERVPVADVLGEMTVFPLPDGWTATGGLFLVKCTDEEGDPTWAFRMDGELSDEEILGVLAARAELALRVTVESYLPEEE